ncbi:MAG: glucose-6-phosphate isomerase [Gammaproteobacteria bacterium]|nr:glucose-6-phosphate isomerase [Gammaproteobacteria bacterium]
MDWQSFSERLYRFPVLGVSLDLSRMDMDDSWLLSMQPSVALALTEMTELERGGIANIDERRMVGHYWLRAPDTAPDPALGQVIRRDLGRVLESASQILAGDRRGSSGKPFTRVLLVGIGGSALGPQFVSDALSSMASMPISFLDNTDAEGIRRVLDGLGDGLAQTLVVVISKSGGTAETRNGMLEVRARFERAGLDFSSQAMAVTGSNSALDKLARQEGWLDILPMYDWIGGRTSLFSAVGLLPAALQGIDVNAMLLGAATMDVQTRLGTLAENPAMLLALAWYRAGNGHGERNMVVLPYRDRLQLFSRYLQQLVMESLGKAVNRQGVVVHQGLTVYGNKGSTDQHAYVQQLRDGPADFFVTFIEVLNDGVNEPLEVQPGINTGDYLYGFLRGTRSALNDSGRQSLVLTLDELDARSLGAVIALYERAVGFYATLIDVNAYHQPGVEAGKKAAEQILAMQVQLLDVLSKADTQLGIQELTDKLGEAGNEQEVYCLLRRLSANGRVRLTGEIDTISGIRASIS